MGGKRGGDAEECWIQNGWLAPPMDIEVGLVVVKSGTVVEL